MVIDQLIPHSKDGASRQISELLSAKKFELVISLTVVFQNGIYCGLVIAIVCSKFAILCTLKYFGHGKYLKFSVKV